MHGGCKTVGVVFVADDLGEWLVGLLADAFRKKVTAFVLGSDQQRALRRAATAAVLATAMEVSPSCSERAEEIAMAVNEVFGEPVPDVWSARGMPLLDGLRDGIARKLAVLDDASLTGSGQPYAAGLGVSGAELADRLTVHLEREILLGGSRIGPLTPLADQVNHELTRRDVRRVGDMVARLAVQVRDLPSHLVSSSADAGWPLSEVTDPFVLEVHHPVELERPPAELPALPAYVRRKHDEDLERVAAAAAGGSSGIAVLVGGSSTGKTRACWETLRLLRERPEQWRLWHPIDPSRPEAAMHQLPDIGPRTVVWLNEAQDYLGAAENALGEQVAAGLRALLRDPARAPVLVLATLWPRFWDTLTARPEHGTDLHPHARELLAGRDITVPLEFTAEQMEQLSRERDPRLLLAAEKAQDGQVIQFLAGAKELMARYRNAPPAAAALIHSAMDARRLGMGIDLPQAFLEAAAPGYLTDAEWDALGEDWLKQAWAYTAVRCMGVPGPLTQIRRHPVRSRVRRCSSHNRDEPDGEQADIPETQLYRLADFLDQHGRRYRKDLLPPPSFWVAAADCASPSDQATLGFAAHRRGLYRDAAQLHKNAAARGNQSAALYLSEPREYMRADLRPVLWAAAQVTLDDPGNVAELLTNMREAGAREELTGVAERAAAHVPLNDPFKVAKLLESLTGIGLQEQVTVLRERAAALAALDNPAAVARLLDTMHWTGTLHQTRALAERAAVDVALDDPGAVAELLESLQRTDAQEQVAVLAERAAAQVPLHSAFAAAYLIERLQEAGAAEQVAVLAERAAAHTPLNDPWEVTRLLDSLVEAGAAEQIAVLLARDPAARVSLDNLYEMAGLLDSLWRAGAWGQVTALAERAAADPALDDPGMVAWLVDSLLNHVREAGAREQVNALAERAAAHAPLDDPGIVAWLVNSLLEAGAAEQSRALLDRDPAARVSLDDPCGVADLLDRLREAGAKDQVRALLGRDPAARVSLNDPEDVAELLDRLREAGAKDQVTALLGRDPAARVSLDDPDKVAKLLSSMREAGAKEQVRALLGRDPAARVSLDDTNKVTKLLDCLRDAGVSEQVKVLARRLAGAGRYDVFLRQEHESDRFRFGREADGSPAQSWGWDNLD
jgi:uncharacterized protein YidB (DUF937 family)